jgi:hypothetical protein
MAQRSSPHFIRLCRKRSLPTRCTTDASASVEPSEALHPGLADLQPFGRQAFSQLERTATNPRTREYSALAATGTTRRRFVPWLACPGPPMLSPCWSASVAARTFALRISLNYPARKTRLTKALSHCVLNQPEVQPSLSLTACLFPGCRVRLPRVEFAYARWNRPSIGFIIEAEC